MSKHPNGHNGNGRIPKRIGELYGGMLRPPLSQTSPTTGNAKPASGTQAQPPVPASRPPVAKPYPTEPSWMKSAQVQLPDLAKAPQAAPVVPAPPPVEKVLLGNGEEECPTCKGAGFLRVDAEPGNPMFGRAIPCECRLNEQEAVAFGDLQRFSCLEPFRAHTFANFDATLPGIERAYSYARRFANEPDGWLVLLGGFGVGKTHLAAAIANQAISHKFRVLFSIVPDFLDHLRSTFAPTSPTSYDDLFEAIRSCPLLVLDDLGTESGTPWAQEKLYQLVNHRYNYRLPTVITTNRPLSHVDARIASRMQDRVLVDIIQIDAADYRARENGERRDARALAERLKQSRRRP